MGAPDGKSSDVPNYQQSNEQQPRVVTGEPVAASRFDQANGASENQQFGRNYYVAEPQHHVFLFSRAYGPPPGLMNFDNYDEVIIQRKNPLWVGLAAVCFLFAILNIISLSLSWLHLGTLIALIFFLIGGTIALVLYYDEVAVFDKVHREFRVEEHRPLLPCRKRRVMMRESFDNLEQPTLDVIVNPYNYYGPGRVSLYLELPTMRVRMVTIPIVSEAEQSAVLRAWEHYVDQLRGFQAP